MSGAEKLADVFVQELQLLGDNLKGIDGDVCIGTAGDRGREDFGHGVLDLGDGGGP